VTRHCVVKSRINAFLSLLIKEKGLLGSLREKKGSTPGLRDGGLVRGVRTDGNGEGKEIMLKKVLSNGGLFDRTRRAG